jgi:hypothetical protein
VNVFAEFLRESIHEYRKITLLQFGDRRDLIGSAVLKNPGSARLECEVADEEFAQIKSFLFTTQVH